MAQKFARSEDFKTPVGRILYAYNLFKPRKQGEGASAKEKFGATLVFPKSMLSEPLCSIKKDGNQTPISMQDVVKNVIVEQWGDKGLERARQGLIKSPFLMGDGKEARNKNTGEINAGLGPDVFFIRVQANADRPPKVSSSASAFLPASEEEVYSGCYGFGVLNAFAWNNPQNGDGVSFGINMFFKKDDGEKIGGSGGDPDEWTESVEDHGNAPAETQNGAGAGGLFG